MMRLVSSVAFVLTTAGAGIGVRVLRKRRSDHAVVGFALKHPDWFTWESPDSQLISFVAKRIRHARAALALLAVLIVGSAFAVGWTVA
jgi:hypothetical protein